MYASDAPNRYYLSAGILLAATALDLCDGLIARRFDWVTEFGAVLDPLVDKVVANTFFCLLVYEQVFPWWLVSFALLRDLAVQFGRMRAASFGVIVRTFRVSDTRNAIQIAAVIAGLLSLSNHSFVVYPGIGQLLFLLANLFFAVGVLLGYVGMASFFLAYRNAIRSNGS